MSEPSTPHIEAVLFDFGMVLSLAPEAAAWAHMLAVTGLEDDPLHSAYWAHRNDYDRGALTGPAYWQAVGRDNGITLDAAQIDALIAADTDLWTDLNLPMVEWAARLQRAGIKTGILSNIGDSIAQGICAKCSWVAAFDHCTWSHALGMAKPEPAIFAIAAQGLRTRPGAILFVDDRADNIAAARASGIQAIQYADHARFLCEMRERGLGWLLDIAE